MPHDVFDFNSTVERCKSCFMCRYICTSARTLTTEKDTPRGRSLLLSMIRRNTLEYSPDVAAAIYSCCLCAHCRASCMSSFDFPAAAVAAREAIAETGLMPQAIQAARDSLLAHDNPYGIASLDASLHAALAELPKTADILLLLGPDARYRCSSSALAAMAVFRKLDLPFTCLVQEPSSTYLLHEIGASKESALKKDALAAAIAASGARRVVCLDPRAYHRMGSEAGSADKLHFLEVVAEHAGRLRPILGAAPFSYHEPDYLVRWSDMGGQTASVLQALGEAYTPPYWRGAATQSLGSVLVSLYRPDFTERLVRARMEDFAELGVTKVLVATGDDWAILSEPAAAKGIVCEHIAETVAAALDSSSK